MALKATNLSAVREFRTLFSEIDFSISEGQLLLVEGPNGSGKTTLLKLISGLRRADSGDIFWQDTNIQEAECRLNHDLSWLSHQNPLKPDQTALENLQMLSALRKRSTISLQQALKEVGLAKFKHKTVQSFSAGMKRRLALASLITADSKLWVLDEPQASLDKDGIEMFERLALDHLNNSGLIVMTSHHPVNLPASRIKPLRLGS